MAIVKARQGEHIEYKDFHYFRFVEITLSRFN